jgi:ribonucleoside-diphosphate reductase alpha chain
MENNNFIEVKKIEDLEEFTCDIEVENEHEYLLSSGIVSHNTISLLTNYSSAIEPLFAKAAKRKDRVSERIYIHPKYEQMVRNNEEIPEWFVDAFDLEPKDHFEMQVSCQRFCDASVSKTINLPENTTSEDLNNLLLEYIYDLKGVTVYRDGSRYGQILNKISEEEASKYIKENKKIESDLTEQHVSCALGSCEI